VSATLDVPSDLVIGEGVALDLRPASFATRALAVTLDLFIEVALLVGLLFATAATDLADAASWAAAAISSVVIALVALPVTVETLTRGRSLGKLAAGLRVVRDDGGPVRFRQALVRGLVGFFEFYVTTGSVALIASLIDSRGRRLGDVLAGTYVIRVRGPRDTAPPVQMPPALAGWARGADIGRLPDPLAVAVRQYLRRAERLHPASRERLGTELSAAVALLVAPPPPAGAPAEAFLAAVIAARRDRDLVRLRAEQAARQVRAERRANAPLLSPGASGLVQTASDSPVRAGPVATTAPR
jgi:uncharacterized RDD family membrane protein YckC